MIGIIMSKQKLKKVKVKLSDITVRNEGIHYAEWRVCGVFQKFLSRKELERILDAFDRNVEVRMMLVKQFQKKGNCRVKYKSTEK